MILSVRKDVGVIIATNVDLVEVCHCALLNNSTIIWPDVFILYIIDFKIKLANNTIFLNVYAVNTKPKWALKMWTDKKPLLDDRHQIHIKQKWQMSLGKNETSAWQKVKNY